MLAVELEPLFAIIRDVYKSNVLVGDRSVSVDCTTECFIVDGKMVSLLKGDS